jgi:hypothetical protein
MRTNPDDPLTRATFVIPRSVSTVPIPDHKLAIREYLTVLGLTAHERSQVLVVEMEKTPVLRIEFDEQGRMTKFNALVGDITTPIPTEVKPLLPTLD